MLTRRQLEDAAKCPQNGLCTKCEMDCVRTLYNGYFDGCISEAAQTALAYREMLERARKTLQDAWDDDGSATVGKQILEIINAIDALLGGEKMLPAWEIKMLEAELEKRKQEREVKDNEAITRLAEYEDSGLSPEEVQELAKAKAEGRLVVLPCKVGGTVYEPFAGKVYEKTVDRIIINRFTTPQIWIETKLPFAAPRLKRWDIAFGKTVFLTREEAEKALKEDD